MILVLAHFIGDFLLQTKAMAANKTENYQVALLHSLVHIGVATILLVWFKIDHLFVPILLGITHFIIDGFIKKHLHKMITKESFVFIFDQVLHLLCIYALVVYFKIPMENELATLLLALILQSNVIGRLINLIFRDLNINQKPSPLLNQYQAYGDVDLEVEQTKTNETLRFTLYASNEIEHYGFLIGVFERLILMALLLSEFYIGISVLFSLKTFARFKQLDSKTFSEQYVLGTLMSVFFSLAVYFLLFKA